MHICTLTKDREQFQRVVYVLHIEPAMDDAQLAQHDVYKAALLFGPISNTYCWSLNVPKHRAHGTLILDSILL